MKIIGFMGAAGSGKDTAVACIDFVPYARVALADEIKLLIRDVFSLTKAESDEALFGETRARGRLVSHVAGCTHANLRQRVDRFLNGPLATRWLTRLAPEDKLESAWWGLRSVLEGLLDDPDQFTVRRVLQHLGTEWGRTVDPSMWVRALGRTVAWLRVGARYDRGELWFSNDPPVHMVLVPDVRFPNEPVALRALPACTGCAVFAIDPGQRPLPPVPAHASEPSLQEMLAWGAQRLDNTGSLEQFHVRVREAVAAVVGTGPHSVSLPYSPYNVA